jgi:predicted nucleic acid-binding protein
MTIVLDACAVIAYLNNEQGADKVQEYILDTQRPCVIHAVNAFEVHYLTTRALGRQIADDAIRDIKDAGVLILEDMDEAFWKDAAEYKARGRMSPPDTFAIALANRLGGEVVTCDKDFEAIQQLGLCSVTFFRPPRAR